VGGALQHSYYVLGVQSVYGRSHPNSSCALHIHCKSFKLGYGATERIRNTSVDLTLGETSANSKL